MNDDTLNRVVVYWGEAGEDKGWCYATHYIREGEAQVDSSTIADSADWTEAQAIAWAEERFGAEVTIEVGEDDIV